MDKHYLFLTVLNKNNSMWTLRFMQNFGKVGKDYLNLDCFKDVVVLMKLQEENNAY